MKSVLLEFAMLPTDQGESKGKSVSQILKHLKDAYEVLENTG